MKTILLFSTLFSVIAMPALGELTVKTLKKLTRKSKRLKIE